MMTEEQFKAILADHSEKLIKTVKETSADSARESVNTTLTTLGIDVSDPIETQKDFAWVREGRTTCKSIKLKSILVVTGIVIASVLSWIAKMLIA